MRFLAVLRLRSRLRGFAKWWQCKDGGGGTPGLGMVTQIKKEKKKKQNIYGHATLNTTDLV